jgi:hypothetical protein
LESGFGPGALGHATHNDPELPGGEAFVAAPLDPAGHLLDVAMGVYGDN